MYIARILYPVEVLGPGKRIGIWFSGCFRRCKGCSNPELWEFDKKFEISLELVFQLIKKITNKNIVEGFTITGGDPMCQPKDLQKLIGLLQEISTDILVYTGFKKEELPKEYLQGISVLIDGEYIESRNQNCLLRGSDNQKIYILNEDIQEKYNFYLKNTSNQIQNFTTLDGIISVGIHRPNFRGDRKT